MNHLMASAPVFLPRSIGICTHQAPEFGRSFVGTARRCSSHFVRLPDSKLSANNTSVSFAMPASPGYFAARPRERGGADDVPAELGTRAEPASRLPEDAFAFTSGESPDV